MLSEIYSTILKNGSRTYKYRNSTMKPVGHIDSSKSGAIFAYHGKQLTNVGRGMAIASEEAILENEEKLTHWTPSIYRFGTYADEYRTVVRGHSEKNLS